MLRSMSLYIALDSCTYDPYACFFTLNSSYRTYIVGTYMLIFDSTRDNVGLKLIDKCTSLNFQILSI